MTELATIPATPAPGSTGANLIREAAAVMVDAHALAKAVCNTKMIPKHFQGNPDECAAAMLYGASLGLDPMQSVRQIYVVHGQAALYARAMDALVKGAGHETWTVASTDESVTVAGRRRGSKHIEESTWSFERAKKAGYTNNEKYRTDPQAMLYSKALSEVCRKIAPDVLNGVYAVEELQMERWDSVEQVQRKGLGSVIEQVQPDAKAADPDPAPDAITSGQQKKMGALMREAGITDRDLALAFVADVIGRNVGSRNELSKAEAGQVIDALEADAAKAEAGEPVDAEVVEDAPLDPWATS